MQTVEEKASSLSLSVLKSADSNEEASSDELRTLRFQPDKQSVPTSKWTKNSTREQNLLLAEFEFETAVFKFESVDQFKSRFTDTNIFKYELKFKGIPIYGSSVIVELDEDGNVLFTDSSSVVQDQLLKKEFPESTAKIELNDSFEHYDLNPTLYYFYDYNAKNKSGQEQGKWRLVYITNIKSKNPKNKPESNSLNGKLNKQFIKESTNNLSELLSDSFDYVIDAHTGEIVDKLSNIRTVA